MLAAHKNVRILISLLKQYNIRHIVISPGSRNMSIVKSVEDDPFFVCYSVVDERSAAYFAVGLSLEVGAPVAISCTSAQASRNYLPGMTEAYYRKAPILSITADYDESFIGQQNMQALVQTSIPKDAAKVSIDLGIVKDSMDEELAVRNVNLALDALTRSGGGPAHINIRIGAHWLQGEDELEHYKKITRHIITDTEWPEIVQKKVLLVIGQHHPFSDSELGAIEAFAAKFNVAIYVNHISNYSGECSVHGNLRLHVAAFESLEPDLLITIGGHLGDYALDSKIRNSNVEHWRVGPDGQLADSFGLITRVFECEENLFFARMVDLAKEEPSGNYYDTWVAEMGRVALPDNYPLSHPIVAQKLAPLIPPNSNLHFAILNSMRIWEFFEIDASIKAYSNVAGFGIDGCLSTFLGQSVMSDELNFLITGDLSFFYDMNAMGIRQLKNNIRIVLVNNRGGCEFRLKTNAASNFGEDANRHIAAGGHFGNSAEGWVRNNGFDYIAVKTKEDLDHATEKFLHKAERPMLMEVFSSMDDDVDALQAISMCNDLRSRSNKIFGSLKKAIPSSLKSKLRYALRR